MGLGGEVLSDGECGLIRNADPAGIILFARNCRSRDQLRRLTDDLREASGRADLPVLIDQEGGRVQRLPAPEWPDFPAAARFSDLYREAPLSAIEAARVNAQSMAVLLAEAGINVDCLPVLDVRHPEGHDVIGDRALGDEPMQVAALGRAMLEGLEAAGVCGVIKHLPGHGRARTDSHVELPVVDADEEALAADLAPFRALRDAPMGMVAHILYPAWDAQNPASASPIVIEQVIRQGIGFEGLLMSDDIGMKALSGSVADRACAVLSAGCDLALHGSGRMTDNEALARALSPMSEASRQRLERATARTSARSSDETYEKLAAKRDALLAYA